MPINYSVGAHPSSVAVAGLTDVATPSLFSGAFSQELCNVEVYKIGVMKNN